MTANAPEPALVARVERMLGRRAAAWRRVEGGYTPAERWVATLRDGSTAFVKAATSDGTADGLRAERRIYESVRGPFLPRMLAFDAEAQPVLVLEDLSAARWPPPWRTGDVDRVLAAFDALHRTPVPDGLRSLEEERRGFQGWRAVAADSAPFLSLGLADAQWLAHALPVLLRAEGALVLEGDVIVHLDVRSDNACFVGDRAVFVDWNWAARGNPDVDLGAFLPSLHAEGGPPPESRVADAAEVAAGLAGWWAAQTGLPPPKPGSRVREIQRTQLLTALPWACRALGLSVPDALRR